MQEVGGRRKGRGEERLRLDAPRGRIFTHKARGFALGVGVCVRWVRVSGGTRNPLEWEKLTKTHCYSTFVRNLVQIFVDFVRKFVHIL